MADNQKSRGSNFCAAELNQLCASWMHISQDPIVGSAQKQGAFWDRTVKHYNSNRPKDKEFRNGRSLESKWSDLKRDVAKYSGCYQQVVDANNSGDNEEDRIRKAREVYVTKDPKSKEFQYSDQWSFLKECPRFALCMDDMKQKAAQKSARKKKGKGRTSGQAENDIVDAVIDLEDPDGDDDGRMENVAHNLDVEGDNIHSHGSEKRPIGNKAAKYLKLDENSSRTMACAQRDMAATSAKRLMLAEARDRKLLFSMDVDNMAPEFQEYFCLLQAHELKIAMAKLQNNEEELLARNAQNSGVRASAPQEPLLLAYHHVPGIANPEIGSAASVEAPINSQSAKSNDVGPEKSFEAELAQLDRDLA